MFLLLFNHFHMDKSFQGGFDTKLAPFKDFFYMHGPIWGGFDIKFVFLLDIHMDGPIWGGFDIKGCMFAGFSHT